MKQKSKANECLAVGYGTAKEAFTAWKKVKRDIGLITDPEYVYGGVTCFWFDSDNSGSDLTPIWVLEMGKDEIWSEPVM